MITGTTRLSLRTGFGRTVAAACQETVVAIQNFASLSLTHDKSIAKEQGNQDIQKWHNNSMYPARKASPMT